MIPSIETGDIAADFSTATTSGGGAFGLGSLGGIIGGNIPPPIKNNSGLLLGAVVVGVALFYMIKRGA